MRSEYQQQYWQLLPGTALQVFVYSTFHLNHCHSLTKEWLCNPVFQWIQNKPENCRLVPALQEQPCALRQLAVVPWAFSNTDISEFWVTRAPRMSWSTLQLPSEPHHQYQGNQLHMAQFCPSQNQGLDLRLIWFLQTRDAFPKLLFVVWSQKRCIIASLLKPWKIKWLEDKNAITGRSTDAESMLAPR